MEKISTSIKKVAVLPNDKITDEDDRRFGASRDYTILDCVRLSDFGEFSEWFRTKISGNDNSIAALSASVYRNIVLVMVGLSARLVTNKVTVLEVSEDKGASVPAVVARLDSEIDQQKLTSRPEYQRLTDVRRPGKKKQVKDFEGIKNTISDTQRTRCFEFFVKRTDNTGRTGKTILTFFKILELCAREPKEKVFIVCRGDYFKKYYEILTNNGIKCRMERMIEEWNPSVCELDSLLGFTEPVLECQVKILQTELLLHQLGKLNKKWQHNVHVILDDADLPQIALNCPQLIIRADGERFLSWVALDQKQSQFLLVKEAGHKDFKRFTESNIDKRFTLEEVLRNSVEIQLFNAALASHIARFPQKDGNHSKMMQIIVPTFDTKVTEYLCSGWVFFSSDKFRLFN